MAIDDEGRDESRKAAASFIEWLQTAEEEGEDEEIDINY